MRKEQGFTLVEILIILALIAIVSMAIVPKIGMKGFKSIADADSFISYARYAQQESMVTGNNWRIIINSGAKQYILDNDSDDKNSLPRIPGGDNPVSVNTSISSTMNEFYFDYLGRPVTASNSLITTEIKINIDSQIIIIEPYSGGIYEQ